MKKVLVLISVMCLIFMIGIMSVSAENTMFDFEKEADFSNVTATPASGSKIEVVTAPDNAHNKCLHITDNNKGTLSNAGIYFGKQITTKVEASFKVMFSAKGVYSIVLLNGGNDTAMVSFIGREDGKLYTYDGSTQKEISAYELGKWYTVKIVADPSVQKFDLTVDDIEIKGYKFRNSSSAVSSFRAGTTDAKTGDFYIDDISVPFMEVAKVPLRTVDAVEKKSLAKADDDKPNLDYIAFPTLAEVEENKIAVAYKRGSAHMNDPSDLEVTYIDKTTSNIISREAIASSQEVAYQNPQFITMPNGDTYCYTDIQKKGPGRIGVTTHKYNKTTGKWDFIADQFYDDLGIQYGYMFDGICDGNRLYMLAMAFPTLEHKGYGRSVHVIYTDDNGLSWKHFANLTGLIGSSINESAFIMYDDEFVVVSRGDDYFVHLYRIDKNGNLKKYVNLSDTFSNIWQASRPDMFTYNGRYYFNIRNIPDRQNMNYQEFTVYEFDPETLEISEGIVLDSRTGAWRDAYNGVHYVTEKDGKKCIHFILYSTKFTKKPSIDDYVFAFDDIFKSEKHEITVDNNDVIHLLGNTDEGIAILTYYNDDKFVKANLYSPKMADNFKIPKSDSYNRVKIMWYTEELTALYTAKTLEFKNKESLLMGKNISILGDSVSSYAGYSNDTSVNTTLSQNAPSSLYNPGKSAFINISVDDTWWMQMINELDMNLLVCNTWAGSRVFGAKDTQPRYNAYVDRSVNLHANTGAKAGTNPDIIIAFIGLNDLFNNYSTFGSFEAINFDTLITENNGTYHYATPKTFAEAYAIMIHKMIKKYPDADIFCSNFLPESAVAKKATAAQLEHGNDIVFKIADKFNLNKIDLYNTIEIPKAYSASYTADGIHPNAAGMDLFTDAFTKALLEKYSY